MDESLTTAILAALPLAAADIAAALPPYLRARLLGHSFFTAMLVLEAACQAADTNRGILCGAVISRGSSTVLAAAVAAWLGSG